MTGGGGEKRWAVGGGGGGRKTWCWMIAGGEMERKEKKGEERGQKMNSAPVEWMRLKMKH